MHPAVAAELVNVLMPPILIALKGFDIQLKYISERAAKYIFQIVTSSGSSNTNTLSAYAALVDSNSGAFVRDYARRILSKLPDDSDNE